MDSEGHHAQKCRYTAESKYLAYILRHHPQDAGISLDEHGWADVDALAMRAAGYDFFRSENGVWLTRTVPPRYLSLDDPKAE